MLHMKNPLIKKLIFISLVLFLSLSEAERFESTAEYSTCFTPGQDCTQLIIDAIQNSVSDIWVQAYSFTSRPIEDALLDAQSRGVKVKIILDKSVLSNSKNAAELLAQHHIPVWIDEKVGIAHNKVMIIDQTKIITGSFNFTRAAQSRNAENLLIIEDEGIAKKYLANWNRRAHLSRVYHPVGEPQIVVPNPPDNFSFLEWLLELLNWFFDSVRRIFSFKAA